MRKLSVPRPASSEHGGGEVGAVPRLLPSDEQGSGGIPDRVVANDFPGGDALSTLHLALVIPDISVFRTIKSSVYAIKPHDWEGEIYIHCLLPRPDKDDPSLVYRFALTELGLVEPKVADISYPEHIQFGWSDESAPINQDD